MLEFLHDIQNGDEESIGEYLDAAVIAAPLEELPEGLIGDEI